MELSKHIPTQKFFEKIWLLANFLVGSTLCYLVLHDFLRGKTNFTETTEPVTEVPSYVTYIDGTISKEDPHLTYGDDFNISMAYHEIRGWLPNKVIFSKNLTIGQENGLTFEALGFEGTIYKITFPKLEHALSGTMKYGYSLKYVFTNATKVRELVSFHLGSEYSMGVNLDGQYSASNPAYKTVLGGEMHVIFTQEKTQLLKDRCVDMPQNKIIAQKVVEAIEERCPQPCQDKSFNFGQALKDTFEPLPACKNDEDKCFWDSLVTVSQDANLPKSCTTVEYYGKTSFSENMRANEAQFKVLFSSPMQTKVKTEYLVMDGLGLIGSVKSQMGLFIGFSIYSLGVTLQGFLRKVVTYIKKGHFNNPGSDTHLIKIQRNHI